MGGSWIVPALNFAFMVKQWLLTCLPIPSSSPLGAVDVNHFLGSQLSLALPDRS